MNESLMRTPHCTVVLFVLALGTLVLTNQGVIAAEPLHQKIDRLIDASLMVPPSQAASDGEFLRRASLDLCNCIATADEARAFLKNPSTNKREELIDKLLASPRHARRLANFLDVTLMERRTDKYVGRAEWENWLYQACLENRPWDQLVRELLTADGVDPARRGPAKFALEREADHNLLTRDTGRMLFGRDVQCAQCHDHPNVKDYEQREYYGLLAFFQRTAFVKQANGTYVLSEKTEGDPTYQSVFKAGSKYAARPALPGEGPTTESGANEKNGRRELLAKCATAGANQAFRRNMANRLWAMMMGRGIVHPVDLDHSDNPPSHPELLDLLAGEFAAMKFDMRAFLRELALTQTYQRSFDPPDDLVGYAAQMANRLPEFEAQVAAAQRNIDAATSKLQAVRHEAIAARTASDQALLELRTAEAAVAAARKALAPLAAALAESQKQVQLKTEVAASVSKAIEPAKEALAKLPMDADLKLTVDKLQAKSTQLTAELQTLTKLIPTQSDAVKQANEKVQAAEKTVGDLTVKLKQADQQAQPKLAEYCNVRTNLQRAKAELALCERRLQCCKGLAEFSTKSDALAAVEKQAGAVFVEVDVTRGASREAMERNRDHNRLLAAAEKNCESIRQQIATLKQTLEQRQPALQSLANAVTEVEKAAGQLKDEELTRAANTARQRHSALNAAIAGVTKQIADSETGLPAAVANRDALSKDTAGFDQTAASAAAKVAEMESKHQKPLGLVLDAREKFSSARKDVLERLAECYSVAPLKHLSAEQMHWSVLQATGILVSYEAAAETELTKKEPLTDAQKKDPTVLAKRSIAMERDVYGKLASNLSPFVHLYASGAGQPQFEFFATADQALFMENGDTIRAWTAPGVTLIQRLIKQQQPASLADELYLSVFNRAPTSEETAEVAVWLGRRGGPTPAAASELAWALLASAEFRFNH